jgi:hypothetical protein
MAHAAVSQFDAEAWNLPFLPPQDLSLSTQSVARVEINGAWRSWPFQPPAAFQ